MDIWHSFADTCTWVMDQSIGDGLSDGAKRLEDWQGWNEKQGAILARVSLEVPGQLWV